MKPSGRRAFAATLLIFFVVLVALGIWQINGEDETKRVGQSVSSVTFNDVAIGVPEGWSVVTLTQEAPCPPAQDRTVIVADEGLGGDCRAGNPGDSLIWISTLSPIETAPPTTAKIGNTTGWRREQGNSGGGWIAALPQSNVQISFSGSVKDATRISVLDSVTKQ
jgi:hypothetical protein